MEPQKTQNTQSNHGKEQSWKHLAFIFQTILQSFSKQNDIKMIQRSMEDNREPRNIPMDI